MVFSGRVIISFLNFKFMKNDAVTKLFEGVGGERNRWQRLALNCLRVRSPRNSGCLSLSRTRAPGNVRLSAQARAPSLPFFLNNYTVYITRVDLTRKWPVKHLKLVRNRYYLIGMWLPYEYKDKSIKLEFGT